MARDIAKLKGIVEANRVIKEGGEVVIVTGGFGDLHVLQLDKRHLDFAEEEKLTRKNIMIMFKSWRGVDIKYGWEYYRVL